MQRVVTSRDDFRVLEQDDIPKGVVANLVGEVTEEDDVDRFVSLWSEGFMS